MDYYVDSEHIIFEVKKYCYLYDTRHNDFKNRVLKTDAWIAVTKTVIGEKWDQMDENTKFVVRNDVQKRWKSMKDSFLKSIKNDVGKIGDSRIMKKPYIYHKQMSFLREVYEQKKTLRNINTDPNVEAVRTKEQAIVAGSCSRVPKKRKLNPFANDMKENEQPIKVMQDPDEMFLMSQLPQIKKMKLSDKLQFQIEFVQLIQRYNDPNPNSCESSYKSTSFAVNDNILSSSSSAPLTADTQLYVVDNDLLSLSNNINITY